MRPCAHRTAFILGLSALTVASLAWPRAAGARTSATAFVVREDGILATCAHAVDGAAAIQVEAGGKVYSAEVIARDKEADLALLRIEATGLTAAPLAENPAEQGEEVYALGYPLPNLFGAGLKAVRGIVSGTKIRGDTAFLLIDAAINQGFSGGPLLNSRGQVVGVIGSRITGGGVCPVTLAVPIEPLRGLLARTGIALPPCGEGSVLRGPELVKRLAPSLAALGANADPRDTAKVLSEHNSRVMAVAFSPDGRTLACASDDGTIALWETESGRWRQTLDGRVAGRLTCLAFSPDGRALAAGGYERQIALWDAATGNPIGQWAGFGDRVTSVAFSPDGRLLAAGSWDKTVRIWNAANAELLGLLGGGREDRSVTAVSFTPDGRHLLTADWSGRVLLWDLEKMKMARILAAAADPVTSAAVSPDGESAAYGCWDKTVRIAALEDGRGKAVLEGHTKVVTAVAFSPDGSALASCGWDRDVLLWDAETGALRAALRGHREIVNAVAFSPDGRTLASGSSDRTVRLWRLPAP